jgi:hypothetical protein
LEGHQTFANAATESYTRFALKGSDDDMRNAIDVNDHVTNLIEKISEVVRKSAKGDA